MCWFLLGQAVLELVSAKLQLEERYTTLAIWQITPQILRLTLVLTLTSMVDGLFSIEFIAYIYATTSALILLIGGHALWEMFNGKFNLKGHTHTTQSDSVSIKPGLKEVARGSWPYGISAIFYLIYFQSSIVLLKYLSSDESAGLYNISVIILTAVYLFPSVIYSKYLLPKIQRWANQDLDMLHRVYTAGNKMMAAAGVFAMLAVMIIAPHAIPLIFSEQFSSSVGPLVAVSLAIPLRFLSYSLSAPLATKNYITQKNKLMAFGALINVAVNLCSIPALGIWGAVIATLITEIYLTTVYFLASKKFFNIEAGA